MNIAQRVPLTDSGIPKLLEETEIRHCTIHSVDLYDGESKKFRGGRLMVTTHAVYYWVLNTKNAIPSAFVWHLRIIEPNAITTSDRLFFKSPKIIVHFDNKTHIKFSFQESGKDEIFGWIKIALQRRSWEEVDNLKRGRFYTSKSKSLSSHNTQNNFAVGVAGLIQQRKQEQHEEQKFSEAAFADLDALIKNARQAVDLATRYAREQRTNTRESDEAAQAFANMTQHLGLTNIVTKTETGDNYHRSLAIEIDQFIQPLLSKAGGIMTLADVYCLYNRARGTDLISPKDLYQACQQLKSVPSAKISLKHFQSGVKAIQLNSHDESKVIERLQTILVDYTTWLAPADLATKWNIPLQIAMHHLQVAETAGIVCRDESLAGVRFYKNWFAEIAISH